MPYITFEGGKLTAEKKKELVQKLTETAGEIIGIHRETITVVIKENPSENIGVGQRC